MILSPFDSLEEVDSHIKACKSALLELMDGKTVRLNTGGGERLWTSEDLDKLQSHISFLGKERGKFLGRTRTVTVCGRPSR